jgi:flagellar protein FlaG
MIGDIDYLSSDKYIPIIIHSKHDNSRNDVLSREEIKKIIQKESPDVDAEKILKSLEEFNAMDIMNKEVRLSYNKEINRIIISVIDKNTNEVIREIPCKELQNLAKYLREEIGNLYDQKA